MKFNIENVVIEYSNSGPHCKTSIESIFWSVVGGHCRLGGEIVVDGDKVERPYETLVIEDYEASKNDWRAEFHNNKT